MRTMSVQRNGKSEGCREDENDGDVDECSDADNNGLGTVVEMEESDEEEEDVPEGPPQVDASGKPVPRAAHKKKKTTKRRRARKLGNKPQDFQVSCRNDVLKYICTPSVCGDYRKVSMGTLGGILTFLTKQQHLTGLYLRGISSCDDPVQL